MSKINDIEILVDLYGKLPAQQSEKALKLVDILLQDLLNDTVEKRDTNEVSENVN